MSDAPKPLAPFLAPMADAFDQAEQAVKQREAEAKAQAEREADAQAIRDAFARGGMKIALALGRACKQPWSTDEVEDLIYPPEPEPEPAPPGGGDDGRDPPPPSAPDGEDEKPAEWKLKKNPVKPLPKNCPIICLGKQGIDLCFYLTPAPAREFVALDKHDAGALRLLFAGSIPWLWAFHPKFKEQTGEQTNWDAARTADSLIDACGKLGPFDPAERLRGVGAWRGDKGELIWHFGDRLWDGAEWREPGRIGRYVYPGAPALPHPAEDEPSDGDMNAFLKLLDTWNWQAEWDTDPETGQQRDIDGSGHKLSALLLLGFIASALVGGALKWRCMVWLTGDAGSGKTTLQELIEMVMGDSIVAASDATSAGIYQAVGYSTRAAGIDEAENDPFSPKMKSMVELVRQSSSGGKILRGSSDPKKWRGFTARSSFLLSSIIIPPLETADVQRIALLNLGALPEGANLPPLDRDRFALFGQRLRRRLLANWPRWQETLSIYRQTLISLGHDNRSADQTGGLLAMADMVRHGPAAPDSETVMLMCAPFDLRQVRREDTTSEQMLNWLISIALDVFRGGTRMTIGTLVSAAAGIIDLAGADTTPVSCAHALQAHGVFVEGLKDDAWVTLPNQAHGLAKLFEGTRWGTRPGAKTSGWSQSMQRLATTRGKNGLPIGKKVWERRLGGRGWSLPVKVFLRMEEE